MPIHLAFLGCGFATRLHSKTLAHFKQEVRCYYASRDRLKADAYNSKYKGSGYFDSYEAAIENPKIEVILVATPPSSHLALTLQALRAGKHVIVEKPPVLHSRDFAEIRQAQAETGRRVFVAENYFYKPVAVKLRELIGAGSIGEVLFVHVNAIKKQATANWRDEAELSGGGALFEGGIHWINFIANLGFEVQSVRGLLPGPFTGLEKSMLVTIEYANGAVGALYYSWEIPVMLKGLHLSQIYGRHGVITFESNGMFIFVNGAKKRFLFPGVADIAGYRGMFRDFFHAWRTGEEPQMDLARAERDIKIVEAIYSTTHHSQN